MKKFALLLIFALCFLSTITGQEFLDPVKWDVTIKKQQGDEYNILIKATIDEGWHLYSQKQFGSEFEGPIPTEITFNNSPETFELIGKTQEPEVVPIHDPVFDLDVIFFADKVMFIQPIRVINETDLKIIAEVYYSVMMKSVCRQIQKPLN